MGSKCVGVGDRTGGTVFPVGNFLPSGWVPLGTVGMTVWVFVGSALIHSLPLVIGTASGTTGSDDLFW